ncbi:MAG: glutamate mutase L [Chloroflexota bacterium]|nr:glutamate mutase L [Chloroflexota bacterium]
MSNVQSLDSGSFEDTMLAQVGAVLAVDIGSLYTRAALFDVVGDEYRFIARASAVTTAEAPYNDVTAGVYNALSDLEGVIGRKLTDGTRLLMPQRRDGNGIDLFIATSSAAPALRLVVAAVSADISASSAMQAAMSTYTSIVSRITLDEGLHQLPNEDEAVLNSAAIAWSQEQTDKLLALPPDVVLMSGGVDGGPVSPLVRLAKVVAVTAREQGSRAELAARKGQAAPGMPLLIFAGNQEALQGVTDALVPIAEMQSVPNVRPDLQTELPGPAAAAIADIYTERRVPQIPGYHVLSRWVEGPIAPTADCERLIAQYLHRQYGRETLVVDVGAASTGLFLSNSQADHSAVMGDMGLAYGLSNLLATRGAANVLRWLPFEMSEDELWEWALNKVARPLTLPQTPRDLMIEHALGRETLVHGAQALQSYNGGRPPRYDLLVGTGGLLAHTPRPGQAALLLLDALQPAAVELGSVELALDTTLLIPAVGNLARHQPAAAAYIFDRDCLVWLGTAIVVHNAWRQEGNGKTPAATPGSTVAVNVTVERQQGGTENVEVPYGTIRIVPLRPGQRAALTVKPGAGFRVGSGEPGKALKTQPGQEVKGGLVGLVIDARGRPLDLPEDGTVRRTLIRSWLTAMDAIAESGTGQAPGARGLEIVPPPDVQGETDAGDGEGSV